MELAKAYERDPDSSGQLGTVFTVMGVVEVSVVGHGRLALEWEAGPVCDSIADHIVATVADIELTPGPPPPLETETDAEIDEMARMVKLKLLREQFGVVDMDIAAKTFTITNVDSEPSITAIVNDDDNGIGNQLTPSNFHTSAMCLQLERISRSRFGRD